VRRPRRARDLTTSPSPSATGGGGGGGSGGAAPPCDVHDGAVSRGRLNPDKESPTRSTVDPPSRARRHERVWGLPACLGAAVPGQRLAGCLGGGCQGESGQA